MSKNENDRRVQRTRHSLQNACIELILEKGYNAVRIQDILDRANVGRSTFYAHFRDKDDLVASHFESIHAALEEHLMLFINNSRTDVETSSYADLPLMILRYVEHEHRLLKALLGKQSNGIHLKVVRDTFLKVIRSILKGNMQTELPTYQREAVAQYMVNAFLGLIVWWLDDDLPCSVEELYALMMRLIEPGLVEVLEVPSLWAAPTATTNG